MMYLNVNLIPPAGSGESVCTTPKTPEILNSLMSLTSPPLPPTYAHYQAQVGSDGLLSPATSTPGDEGVTYQQLSVGVVEKTRERSTSGSTTDRSPTTSGGTIPGSSPPVTPDLPSPINTVEATKSALIKEGLKLQIWTKLRQTGGVSSGDILNETKLVKDELTHEDEERRRRRRERNKVAATKCRNRKKERTCILMSESETVEDVNARLKNEIQRLTNEKQSLEKLLSDPAHRASCRHTRQANHNPATQVLTIPSHTDTPVLPSCSTPYLSASPSSSYCSLSPSPSVSSLLSPSEVKECQSLVSCPSTSPGGRSLSSNSVCSVPFTANISYSSEPASSSKFLHERYDNPQVTVSELQSCEYTNTLPADTSGTCTNPTLADYSQGTSANQTLTLLDGRLVSADSVCSNKDPKPAYNYCDYETYSFNQYTTGGIAQRSNYGPEKIRHTSVLRYNPYSCNNRPANNLIPDKLQINEYQYLSPGSTQTIRGNMNACGQEGQAAFASRHQNDLNFSSVPYNGSI